MHLTLLLQAMIGLGMATVPLIIDTDMDFDVDDVGALCVAHALQDLGEVDLLAVVHNAGYPTAIGAVSVINHFYNRDEVPLGAFKGEFGRWVGSYYVDDLVENWPAPIHHYDQVDEPVPVLRQVLSTAEDHSVVISSVGFLTNLADLLSSQPDTISNLSGRELVRNKVKLVAIMGGVYPESEEWSEFNFNCGQNYMGDPLECLGKSMDAVAMMPPEVKMVFSGAKVGADVQSGGALSDCAGDDNPCRQAYIDYVGYGNTRSSWDPLTTLYAVRGLEAVGCREEGLGGTNVVGEYGDNWWNYGQGSNQSYLVLEKEPWEIGAAIDELLCSRGNY